MTSRGKHAEYLRDLARFVFGGRRRWLLPLVVLLLLALILAVTGALHPWAVFIYPL